MLDKLARRLVPLMCPFDFPFFCHGSLTFFTKSQLVSRRPSSVASPVRNLEFSENLKWLGVINGRCSSARRRCLRRHRAVINKSRRRHLNPHTHTGADRLTTFVITSCRVFHAISWVTQRGSRNHFSRRLMLMRSLLAMPSSLLRISLPGSTCLSCLDISAIGQILAWRNISYRVTRVSFLHPVLVTFSCAWFLFLLTFAVTHGHRRLHWRLTIHSGYRVKSLAELY